MTLCLVLSLSPLPPPALSCLLASISPPPARLWEEQAAMMIAWRVSSPACLPVVDFPMPPHRCRLVGRGGGAGRIRPLLFRRGDLSRVYLVVPSLGGAVHFLGVLLRGVAPIVSPSYLLAYHCPSRPSSRFSSRRASRCACLALDVFFLCVFSSFAGVLSLLDLSPRSSRSVVSSSRLVLRLVSDGGSSCACSIAPIAFSSRPCRLVGRDG